MFGEWQKSSMGGWNGVHGRITGDEAGEVDKGQVVRGWMCWVNEFTVCLKGKKYLLKCF